MLSYACLLRNLALSCFRIALNRIENCLSCLSCKLQNFRGRMLFHVAEFIDRLARDANASTDLVAGITSLGSGNIAGTAFLPNVTSTFNLPLLRFRLFMLPPSLSEETSLTSVRMPTSDLAKAEIVSALRASADE